MACLRRFAFFCVLLALACFVNAHAAVSPQRIAMTVDDSRTAPLPGNVPVEARRAVDVGMASPAAMLTELSLRFNMSVAQQAALTQLLSDQQNPASPRYRQWLTPEQFGAQFGLAAQDLQKVSNWLTAQGFTVTQVARGGSFIRFTGTVAQAESAFHTDIHRVTLDGQTYIANLTEPSLPVAIASVTAAITGLHDFRLKPHHREWTVTDDTVTVVTGTGVTPSYTSAATGNHFLAPGDFHTIYDEKAALTGGINGTGVTIAVAGQTDISLTDVGTFRSLAGLAVNPPTIKLYGVDPGTSTTDLLEATLDVEWSGATAPGASILYVNSKDVINSSLTGAIDDNLAAIVTVSYGTCEANVSAGALNFYNGLMQQANSQGQTVVSAAGDSGATDCDYHSATAAAGLAVDFPASLPSVTGVGGTQLTEGTGTYWGANSGTAATALSYIPENVWNEDASGTLGSGGGGSSTFFTKPYWQVAAGVPADSARDVPDISLTAASAHDGYLVCATPFCVDGWKNITGTHDVVGGTSVGAPAFAGILALVEQKIGARVGNANPTLYALANSTYYSTVFHDITVGGNASPCIAGAKGCPAGGVIGYNAGPGYDLATGLGTLDIFNLVNDWALVTPLLATTGTTVSSTALAGAPLVNVVQGTNINLTATVGSATSTNTSTPSGTVQFLLDNVAFGAPVALVSGQAALTVDTRLVAYGARNFGAAYSGDAVFAGSKAQIGATIISSATPDFTLTPATVTASATAGSAATGIVFTLNGLNSFAGTVTLTATTNSSFSYSLTPATVTLSNTKTVGTATLTLNAVKSAAVGAPVAAVHSTWYTTGGGVAVAGLLLIVLPRRRRFVGALAAVLSLGMLGAMGCGGGGSASTAVVTPANYTPPGTYTVTVTATGASGATTVTKTATVTFIVN